MMLEIAASSSNTSATSVSISVTGPGVVDHQRIGDRAPRGGLDVAGEVLRLQFERLAAGVGHDARAGLGEHVAAAGQRSCRCVRASRPRREPVARRGIGRRRRVPAIAIRNSTRARGEAWLSGVPLPLVGKSNWSAGTSNSSVSAVRSAARAPSMVVGVLGETEQAQAQVGAEVQAHLQHEPGDLSERCGNVRGDLGVGAVVRRIGWRGIGCHRCGGHGDAVVARVPR